MSLLLMQRQEGWWAVNYPDEDYVRFYTRDTITWLALEFEGQAVMSLMLHGRFNRSGIFDCGGHDPSHAVTLAIRCPKEIAEKGLARLLETKTWVLNDGKIIWPNYVHAQHCKRSDRARKAESRENLAQEALGKKSQPVTAGHSRSQPVTPKPKPRPKQKPKPKLPAAAPSLRVVPPEQPRNPPVQDEPPASELQAKALVWARDVQRAVLQYPNPHLWPEMVELNQLVADVFNSEAETLGGVDRHGRLDERVERVLQRWAEGTTQERMKLAIQGAALDPWVVARSHLHSIGQIFKDGAVVDKYYRLAKNKSAPDAPLDKSNRVRRSAEAERKRELFKRGEI